MADKGVIKEIILLREVHQAVFGIKGTEEKGIIGDVKDIKLLLVSQNGKVNKNSNNIGWIIKIGAPLISIIFILLVVLLRVVFHIPL